jgi:hypothetical protein
MEVETARRLNTSLYPLLHDGVLKDQTDILLLKLYKAVYMPLPKKKHSILQVSKVPIYITLPSHRRSPSPISRSAISIQPSRLFPPHHQQSPSRSPPHANATPRPALKLIREIHILPIRQIPERALVAILIVQPLQGRSPLVLPPEHKVQCHGRSNGDAVTISSEEG